MEALTQEREDVTALIRQLIESNAAVAISQEEYNRKYDRLVKRSEKLSAKLAELQKEHDAGENAGIALSGFLFEIGELEDMDIQFRPQRFAKTVERITVHSDGKLVFRFLVGKEVTVGLR